MRYLTFNLTDLQSFNSKSYPIKVHEDDEVVAFTRDVAKDLAQNLPGLQSKGLCVALYDENGQRILVMPLDSVQ